MLQLVFDRVLLGHPGFDFLFKKKPKPVLDSD
jgi:hypothetical protein